MCCRYFIQDDEDDFAEYLEQAASSPLGAQMAARLGRPLKTAGEVFPTDAAPVVARDRNGSIRAFPMVWGFSPGPEKRGRPLINARAETAAALPAFRESWTARRCIVLASFYFEWGPPPEGAAVPLTKDGKARYIIRPASERAAWLAGLYRTETVNGLVCPAFTILTRASAGDMRRIHGRMPLLLPSSLVEEWILTQDDPMKTLRNALTDLSAAAG